MVNKLNLCIIGSESQLGKTIKDISRNYDYNFFFNSKKNLDITNFKSVENYFVNHNINSVINCAAFTDVNAAENNRDLAENINHISVDNIAKLCERLKIQLLHISTDYVFDGKNKTPYNESDKTNPKNHYGKTKLNGEKKIMSYNLEKSIIIRTSWLYSKYDNNFVSNILYKLKKNKEIYVVSNEIGSPTNSSDLSEFILEIIPRLSNTKTEIYHFSNLGFCSRFQFAKKINELIGASCIVNEVKKKNKKIIRPGFSALDCTKISEKFQLKIKSWEKSLALHIKNNYS